MPVSSSNWEDDVVKKRDVPVVYVGVYPLTRRSSVELVDYLAMCPDRRGVLRGYGERVILVMQAYYCVYGRVE